MISQHAPGALLPFIYENLPYDVAVDLAPKLDTYYVIKTTKTCAMPSSFTGRAMGNIIFIHGEAKVRTLYEKRLLLMRGCVDATPNWMVDQLKKRDLKKILVIRNAAFGDVTILSPGLVALRERYPDAMIHFYGREDSRDVMLFNSYVDAIIDIRTTEIGQLVPMYDEVFDLVHSIECNPSADYKAALDVAHELMMLDEPKKTQKNIYVPNKTEVEAAQKSLFELGIDLAKNNLVVFQFEGTALARSLSPLLVFKVANTLAEAGCQILLWSHKTDILGYGFYRCKETDTMSAHPKTSEDKEVLLVNKFGNKTSHERLEFHPDVKFVLQKPDKSMMTYSNRRSKFAMCFFAKHIISVDSFISHLADALDKPSTIIFTNYHPYTRAKYYSKCDIVTVDFDDELACGPCNGLLNDCPFNKGSLPPCSLKLKPDQIIDKVLSRLRGEIPLYEDMRDGGALPDNYDKQECECKVCKSKDTMLITVKGKIPYHRCLDCYSIFANKPPLTKDLKHLKHPLYCKNRNIENIKDFKTMLSNLLKQSDLPKFTDVIRVSDQDRVKADIFKDFKRQEQKIDDASSFLDVALIIDLLGEFETPEAMLEYLDSHTSIGNQIVAVLPNAEHWDHSNTWSPILQPIAGINQIVYSHEAFVRMFVAETGVFANRYQIAGAMDMAKDLSIYCLKRIG